MGNPVNISALVRPNIRDLSPYRSARDDFDSGLLMDANENAMGSPVNSALELNRYPSPLQKELRGKIAAFRNVRPENVFVGVGSDEPIDLLIRIFCEPGRDSVITTPPTYGMYRVSARINNVEIREVQLDEEFQPQTGRILETVDEKTKILFLCSPNNPTANDIKRESLLELIDRFPGIVVVDEAYIDFSETESLAPLVEKYPNLVVLQTFSKAFGLAGIRLGIAISSPEIISLLMKIKAPYSINKLTTEVALKAFDNLDRVKTNIRTIQDERKKLVARLGKMPSVSKIYPSDANFLLFRVKNAKDIYQKLAGNGVVIRYRGNEPGCHDCLRVTVGTPEENSRFIETLNSVLTAGTVPKR